ncbi:dUTP diphosphatase [Salicibibacter kimchii]|uniref:dUTP diphosphatase n=1 Tax=Salicibibacter kimchii TaxID=2099786 RepID=A0A345C4C5_9BACI|nr:dUTP diphosphatase [Salicibibacter kimchii]AXF58056.1 deoxyuridine 5'-triphosphate nucleotidohydrolase [Salicibibacter kimchii]
MNVQVKKLTADAKLPSYGSDSASGFDLYADEEVIIAPGESKKVKIGLAFAIPNGYEMQIRPRSGMSKKTKLRLSNAPGTIDADYRGEVAVLLDNTSETSTDEENIILSIQGEKEEREATYLKGTYIIQKHDRIAQGVLQEVPRAVFSEVDVLDETVRGTGGFGSTGVK